MGLYIVLGIVLIIVLYAIILFNNLINARNSVNEAFATMDVYLKQRWDLIPNLVKCVKAYTEHEKEVLEEITNLRAQLYDTLNKNAKLNANEKITNDLNKIIALAENYPELKASEVFLDLQEKLTKVEDDIAYSRKYYNANVRDYNYKVEMFPSNLIANLFNFKKEKMFAIFESERSNPEVNL